MDVFLIAASSLDGYIAPDAKEARKEAYSEITSTSWTSEADLKHYVKTIKTADAIVVGSSTFSTFKRYPKGSHWVIYTQSPSDFTNPKPSVITTEATNEDPELLLARLRARGFKRVAIAGGRSIYSQFLENDLVDRLLISVHPILFGSGVKIWESSLKQNLVLVDCKKLDDKQTVLLEYARKSTDAA